MPKLIHTGDDGARPSLKLRRVPSEALAKEGAGTEHEVADVPLTIGRSPECDIRLSDPSVSRLHAVVEASNNAIEIRDQGSKQGIRVNGSQVTDALLRDGDELKVGKIAFKVAIEAKKAPAPPARPKPLRRGEGPRSSRRRAAGSGGAAGGEEGGRPSPRLRSPPSEASAKEGGRIPSSRRPKKEVLGGAKLSKRQQTIIKIVCAAVMLICIYFFMQLLNSRSRGGVTRVNRITYVDETDDPKRLLNEARDLARRGREAELAGNTAEAHRSMNEAKDRIDRAQGLTDTLGQKYQGDGYRRIHRLAAEVNQKAQTIRQEEFRLRMQLERDRGEM